MFLNLAAEFNRMEPELKKHIEMQEVNITRKRKITDLNAEELTLKIRGFDSVENPTPVRKHNESDAISQCDAIVATMRKQLDSLTYNYERRVRTYQQRLLHAEMIIPVLPILYGNNWDMVRDRVLRQFNVSEVLTELIVTASRQTGKSHGIAQFVAVMVALVPRMEVAIFAQNKMIAAQMMDNIIIYMENIPNVKEHIVAHNQTKMKLYFGHGDRRSISCYAARGSVSGTVP